jgi:transglutaminase-like putative cysteine protease
VVAWRNNAQAPGERKAVSPLVKIRDRLLNQTNVPLFTVEANQRAYWRLTSLDNFDGEIWKSAGKFGEADGDLAGEGADNNNEDFVQRYSIENLNMIWAPAAYRPVKVLEKKVELNWNEDSSTLIVEQGLTLDGANYSVVSRYSQPSRDELIGVTAADIPKEIRDDYLGLPDDFSETARNTAKSVTANDARPYAIAMALQKYFRDPVNLGGGGFKYSTDFDLGHDENAIDAFLRDKQGFCEQFAGTYAAMARAVGLPSRVAVGFTPGLAKNANTPNLYQVTGRQTHAWPEVYLGPRHGWVMFEPTPGRGAPNADWTGIAEAQDDGAVPNPTATSPSLPNPGTQPFDATPQPPTTSQEVPVTPTTEPPEPDRSDENERVWYLSALLTSALVLLGVVVVVLGMALLAGLYLVVLRHLVQQRRLDRRARATDASRLVLVAWQECLEALQPLGLAPRPTESHDEFASRVAPQLGDAGPDLIDLADAVNHADYARDLVDHDVAVRATNGSASVVATAELLVTPVQQWLHRLDPRTLTNGDRRPMHKIQSY